MARVKAPTSPTTRSKPRPALTPEAREQQLISLAVDLVEQRLIDGTASSQETTHFLKLATQKYREELSLVKAQKEKAEAQVEAMKANVRSETMYEEVLKAFKDYNGKGDPEEYDDCY